MQIISTRATDNTVVPTSPWDAPTTKASFLSGTGGADPPPVEPPVAAAGLCGDKSGASLDFADLVSRIQRHDASATVELYNIFVRGLRYLIRRKSGAEGLDDRVHDAFVIVLEAIQNGRLREPERVLGFARTVCLRQAIAGVQQRSMDKQKLSPLETISFQLADRAPAPEDCAYGNQKAELTRRVLLGMSGRDREVLTRFYLYEESQVYICQKMKLTATQFRLLKSRAKARFEELAREKLIAIVVRRPGGFNVSAAHGTTETVTGAAM